MAITLIEIGWLNLTTCEPNDLVHHIGGGESLSRQIAMERLGGDANLRSEGSRGLFLSPKVITEVHGRQLTILVSICPVKNHQFGAGLPHRTGDNRAMNQKGRPKYPNRIKELRLLKGLTQPELAEATDCTYQQISRLELGQRKLSQEWMNKLSGPLGVDPGDLLPVTGKRAGEQNLNLVEESVQARIARYVGLLDVAAQERVAEFIKASILVAFPGLKVDDITVAHGASKGKKVANK